MPINARISLGTLLLLAGLVPFPVGAQTIPSPYRFVETRQQAGVFAGTMSPGTGRFGFGPGEGVAFGARYGLRLSGPLELEGVATYLPTKRDLVDPGRYDPAKEKQDLVVGEVDANIVTLDARLRFSLTGDRTWHGLAPFLFAGGGVAFDVAGKSQAESVLLAEDRFSFSTTFLGVMGGGMEWHLTERWEARTDLNLFLWRLSTPIGYRDSSREFTGVGEKEWVSGPAFSLGLAYRF